MTDIREKLETARSLIDEAHKMNSEVEREVEDIIKRNLDFDHDVSTQYYTSPDRVEATISTDEFVNNVKSEITGELHVRSQDFKIVIYRNLYESISGRNIKSLLELIRVMQEHFNEGAPHDEVMTEAMRHLGYDNEDVVIDELEKLKMKGDIYEPRGDVYRATS